MGVKEGNEKDKTTTMLSSQLCTSIFFPERHDKARLERIRAIRKT
jgi:hypothetical protein